jgi:hypothetical protein
MIPKPKVEPWRLYLNQVQNVNRRAISFKEIVKMESRCTVKRVDQVHLHKVSQSNRKSRTANRHSIGGFGVTPVLSWVQYNGMLPRCWTYEV